MSARILVPIRYATARLSVDKGRIWSVVEHLVLDALKAAPAAAAELARSADLPHRIVVESLINLMRVGWVEIHATGTKVDFAITDRGRHNVDSDILPNATVPLDRPVKFIIEQVCGSVMRWRDVTFISPIRALRFDGPDIVRLPLGHDLPEMRQGDIVEKVLDEDETFRDLRSKGSRLGDGWALATVVGDRVEGLPADAPARLREMILDAAGGPSIGVGRLALADRQNERASKALVVHVDDDDVFLGGEAHREVLFGAVRRAKALLIIHSTFLREESFTALLGEIEVAVRERGVVVHLFWGKGDELNPDKEIAALVSRLRGILVMRELHRNVTLHPFSTGSHAKIMVADDGRGSLYAVVGSCNWLFSDWRAFECSVRLRDGPAVGSVLDVLADMAFRATGDWGGIAADLSGRARDARKAPVVRRGARVVARLLLGSDHVEVIEQARDEAVNRIVVGSHRLGAAVENMVLKPMRNAVARGSEDGQRLAVALLYNRPSDQITPAIAAEMVFKAREAGIELRQVGDPPLHAKFIVWDDEDVVITSQNLLSADPMGRTTELGIHLKGAGLGRRLRERIAAEYGLDLGMSTQQQAN